MVPCTIGKSLVCGGAMSSGRVSSTVTSRCSDIRRAASCPRRSRQKRHGRTAAALFSRCGMRRRPIIIAEVASGPHSAGKATEVSREFWVSSGHQLTRRAPDGRLAVTDELLAAYLARPELVPPPEACAAERALHRPLLPAPRRPVLREQTAALADSDAREN